MENGQLNFLNVFILISGAITVFQFVPLLSAIRPLGFSGLGVLQKELVLVLVLAIIALSLALVIFAAISMMNRLIPNLEMDKFRLIPMIAGVILIVLGLASINFSGTAVSGASMSIFPLGVEMFSLGTISLSLFVDKMGGKCLIKGVPNYAFLLFFLSLVPAAFLIAI